MKLETALELIKLDPAIEMLNGETKKQVKALLDGVEEKDDEEILKLVTVVRLSLGLKYGIVT